MNTKHVDIIFQMHSKQINLSLFTQWSMYNMWWTEWKTYNWPIRNKQKWIFMRKKMNILKHSIIPQVSRNSRWNVLSMKMNWMICTINDKIYIYTNYLTSTWGIHSHIHTHAYNYHKRMGGNPHSHTRLQIWWKDLKRTILHLT